jgi:hypothetical protein
MLNIPGEKVNFREIHLSVKRKTSGLTRRKSGMQSQFNRAALSAYWKTSSRRRGNRRARK